MNLKTVKTMAKISAILSIVGSVLVVLAMAYGAVLGFQAAQSGGITNMLDVTKKVMSLNVLVGLIGTATFVLAILLIINLKKFNEPITAAILLIIAGVFAWIVTFVSLVLWIIAAVFLLRMKFEESPTDDNAVIE